MADEIELANVNDIQTQIERARRYYIGKIYGMPEVAEWTEIGSVRVADFSDITVTFYPGTESIEPDPIAARKAENERLWALVMMAAGN